MAPVYAALVTVQVLFGLWPIAGALALREVSPAALIGFRTLVGGPVLFVLVRGVRAWPTRRDALALAVLALFGIAGNQLLYAEGLQRAGPINAVVMIVIVPAMTLLFGAVLGRERPNLRRRLGVLVTMVGILILVRAERFDLSSETLVGNLLFVGNTASYALYLVLAKPVVARVGALATVGWIFVFGAMEALPWTGPAVLSTDWTGLSPGAYGALAFILVGPTIGTYFLNAYALKHVDASVVAIFIGLQPIVGAVGAWLALGQVPSPRTGLAATVIVGGVLLTSIRTPSRRPSSPPRGRSS